MTGKVVKICFAQELWRPFALYVVTLLDLKEQGRLVNVTVGNFVIHCNGGSMCSSSSVFARCHRHVSSVEWDGCDVDDVLFNCLQTQTTLTITLAGDVTCVKLILGQHYFNGNFIDRNTFSNNLDVLQIDQS